MLQISDGGPPPIIAILTTPQTDFVLTTWLIANGYWDGVALRPLDFSQAIGARFTSSSPTIPAFDTGTFPAGFPKPTFRLYDTCDGHGGVGGTTSTNGGAGGKAMILRLNVKIIRLDDTGGKIRGGGGAGAGADSRTDCC